MSRVKAVIANNVFDPRKFLLVAGLLVAMGLITGYVDVQNRADRALALRQGPPPAVALQNFAPTLHTGPAREVTVLAEVDLADPLLLSLRGSNPMKTAVVFPLFPISDRGAEVINARLEDPARVAVEGIETGPEFAFPNALGLLFHILPQGETDLSKLDAYLSQDLGSGAFGEVIELNGEAVEPGSFTLMADGALAAKDLKLAQNYLAVAPYVDGRKAALALPPQSREHQKLYWAALVLVLLALLLSVRADRLASAQGGPTDIDADDDLDGASSHPMFAPIPSQSELRQAEMARTPGRDPGITGAVARAIVRGFGAVLASVRNRRSRQED